MASNKPYKETQETVSKIRAFVASLELTTNDTARVVDILNDIQEALSLSGNEKNEGASSRALIHVTCKIVQVIFKEGALVEKKLIEKAVSESWYDDVLQNTDFVADDVLIGRRHAGNRQSA
jgi:hypothetical protein